MRTQLEEITIITDLLKDKSNQSYRNLESINTGSAYKTKASIVDDLCSQSRKSRRLNQILHSCLDSVIEGMTIQEFYDWKTQQATRNDQCKQDAIESQEELAMLTELIVEI